jgi:hypothetical protein
MGSSTAAAAAAGYTTTMETQWKSSYTCAATGSVMANLTGHCQEGTGEATLQPQTGSGQHYFPSIAQGIAAAANWSTAVSDLSAISTAGNSGLPQYWDLQTSTGFKQALQHLMPGYLAPKDYTRLSKTVSKIYQYAANKLIPMDQGHVPLLDAELLPLLHAVDFSSCSTFYDPFAGTGIISKVMSTAGYQVLQNDINPRYGHALAADALQPFHYQVPTQVLISSPPFDLLDIAAPLLAEFAHVVACIHVPGHWISNPRVARQHWLSQLAAQDRLHVIMGLPRGPSHRKCAWVLVFSSAYMKNHLLRPGETPIPCSFAYC